MVAAVARQVRLANEADRAIDIELDAVVLNHRDHASHHGTLFDAAHRLGERVFAELLDAKADPFLVDIDVEHAHLDHVAFLVVANGFLAGALPVQVRHMNQTVDVTGQANEQSEFGDVLDLALDLGTRRVHGQEGVPGVVVALLEAQADTPLLRVHRKHHDLDLLAGRDDLAGMDILLGPTHFGDMDQPLDPGLQLDEGAVIGDVGHPPGVLGADRVLGFDAVPRIRLELLHAQADALRFKIEADHLDIDRLADAQNLGGVVDAAPRDIGDVQQSIDLAQIDEGAVIGDVLDHAFQHLAFLEAVHKLGAGLGAGFLHHGAARYHDVAAAPVHLENLERLLGAHQRRNVAHRADIDLAARQKSHRAAQVHREAALDAAENRAFDPVVVGERLFEHDPGLFAARPFPAEHRLAVAVLYTVEKHLDRVTDLDLRRLSGKGKFLQRHPALGLQSDVDHRQVVLDRDDASLDHRTFGDG